MVGSPDGLEAAVLHALGELRSQWERIPPYGVPDSRHLLNRPMVECDPVLLGVHRAIQAVGESDDGTREDDLPEFVIRAHDRALRAEIAPAVTGSKLIVLVGGSSTGKTRSAVEAVRELLSDWRLIYALTAADLVTSIAAGQVTAQPSCGSMKARSTWKATRAPKLPWQSADCSAKLTNCSLSARCGLNIGSLTCARPRPACQTLIGKPASCLKRSYSA